jgi:uncharacterized protein (TIGR01244 family)
MKIFATTATLSPLDDYVFVSGQITPQDIAELSSAGVIRVVCHRPDFEESDQPTAASIADAAAACGISFVHIPVRGLPDAESVAATARALEDLGPDETILLFCRSGMRSSAAWAMARSRAGANPDELRARAAAAGYDLSRVPL